MNGPLNVEVSPDKHVASIAIPMQGNGTDTASTDALAALRGGIVQSTVGSAPGVEHAYVTGTAAGTKDFNDLMKHNAPIVFAFVLSLAFVLLLVTFRSIVIPIKAIALNLLSVGAAYGILTWIFQDGRFEKQLGYHSNGGIAGWLPMFLFVILFGLSMDYHVFILTRVREAFDRGMKTEDAVAHGIKTTAGTVTSAAIVMVVVFGMFATESGIEIKELGVGLALAILIDATIVRAVLLPATMKLLGKWNWYLPQQAQLAAEAQPRAQARRGPRPGLGPPQRRMVQEGPAWRGALFAWAWPMRAAYCPREHGRRRAAPETGRPAGAQGRRGDPLRRRRVARAAPARAPDARDRPDR